MDKYKITSPKLVELKARLETERRQVTKTEREICAEQARLAKAKADALCEEMSKRKAKK
jgi:multidrug resistance efflux pump